MSITKKTLQFLGFVLSIPFIYLLISLVLTYIPVNTKSSGKDHSIYLSTNGMHLDIIIPKNEVNFVLPEEHSYQFPTQYLAFGWGDRAYYIDTKAEENISFSKGCKALFIPSPSLLHVTKHMSRKKHWVEIRISSNQLKKINAYINNSFRVNNKNQKIIVFGAGYTKRDVFYEANGNYTCFNTCNSWVNTGLKQSDIKASLWTPFDFGLLYLHKNSSN